MYFHSTNLPILKIIFSPDQNFDASVTTLFKRKQRKKVFLKRRCSSSGFSVWGSFAVKTRSKRDINAKS